MVLYDENYKFLGISGSLLQRLGYEDISDFSSLHRDFADLFEKENGLIYNFDNFSWIDFILYGGANKDKAIIKTKNNKKMNVQIEIQEIFLKDDINGVEKLFQIKLIGSEIENFTPTHDDSIPQTKEINLSSFLDNSDEVRTKVETPKENPIDKEPEPTPKPLSINLSFLKDDDVVENDDTKTTIEPKTKPEASTLLNLNKEADPTPTTESKTDDNHEIVLNFFKDISLKENTTENKVDIDLDDKKEEPKTEPKTEPKIELNFLKKEEEPVVEPLAKEVKETPISINLDFLNKDKKEEVKDPEEDPKIKSNIINQIKNDIKEIDSDNKFDLLINENLKPKEEENTINNALKSILNISKKQDEPIKKEPILLKPEPELKKEEEAPQKNIIKPTTPLQEDNNTQEVAPLSSLDIDEEDKKEIIKDFINEANHNIDLIKEFIKNNDYNSINYAIIKINSSAEILSLSSINNYLSQLKQALISKDLVQVDTEIKKLDNALDALKKYT